MPNVISCSLRSLFNSHNQRFSKQVLIIGPPNSWPYSVNYLNLSTLPFYACRVGEGLADSPPPTLDPQALIADGQFVCRRLATNYIRRANQLRRVPLAVSGQCAPLNWPNLCMFTVGRGEICALFSLTISLLISAQSLCEHSNHLCIQTTNHHIHPVQT